MADPRDTSPVMLANVGLLGVTETVDAYRSPKPQPYTRESPSDLPSVTIPVSLECVSILVAIPISLLGLVVLLPNKAKQPPR